jgi:hypothetical protein
MKQDLSEAMKTISEKEADDSPVYTFIKDLKPPMLTVAEAIASVAATLPLQSRATPDIVLCPEGAPGDSDLFSVIT